MKKDDDDGGVKLLAPASNNSGSLGSSRQKRHGRCQRRPSGSSHCKSAERQQTAFANAQKRERDKRQRLTRMKRTEWYTKRESEEKLPTRLLFPPCCFKPSEKEKGIPHSFILRKCAAAAAKLACADSGRIGVSTIQ